MWRVNTWTLKRWTRIELQDYTKLLRLARDYVVSEVDVHQEDWLAGKTLAESQLAREGVLVLGIERHDGKYVGAPQGGTRVEAGDTLIVYGGQDTLQDLTRRRDDMLGNLHHVMAVTRQLNLIEEETGVLDEEAQSSETDDVR